MQIKHGKATLEVDFQFQEEEYPGDYYLEFITSEYVTLQEACPFGVDDDNLQMDTEEETIATVIADDFIRFLEAAGIEGGTYNLIFHGNPYWLFHDADHAKHDCHGGAIYVNDRTEHRALWQGAIAAWEHGVKLGLIFRALSSAEAGYRERFQTETNALEMFADSLDMRGVSGYTGV